MTKRRNGFTLVELLIAIVILGVVLVGLLSLITGTLSFSSVSVSSSDRVRELNDVTGYIADRVRGAINYVPNSSLPSLQLNGASCNEDAAMPCFGAVVGFDNDVSKPGLDAFEFFGYRVIPRSDLGADYKQDDSWADTNTYVIQEYRRWICTSIDDAPCSGEPPKPASYATISGAQPALVLDGLVLTDETGSVYKPFEVSGDSVILRFRVADHRRGTTRYTPADGIYTLTVIKRN